MEINGVVFIKDYNTLAELVGIKSFNGMVFTQLF